MDKFSLAFIHGIGWGLLWIFGMFIIPLVVMIIFGFITDFDDYELGKFVFWITFIIYWIATALLLIFVK